jgi:Arc/MetJ-type ribon-helix-helix transcriptional regulator
MDTLQIPMSTSMKAFLEKQATKRGFDSPIEYVQSLLNDVQERESAKNALEEKLREGMQSPSVEAGDSFWRDLKEEFVKKHPQVK